MKTFLLSLGVLFLQRRYSIIAVVMTFFWVMVGLVNLFIVFPANTHQNLLLVQLAGMLCSGLQILRLRKWELPGLAKSASAPKGSGTGTMLLLNLLFVLGLSSWILCLVDGEAGRGLLDLTLSGPILLVGYLIVGVLLYIPMGRPVKSTSDNG